MKEMMEKLDAVQGFATAMRS